MTYLIFIGDMLVMAFMIGLGAWLVLIESDERIDATAQIPLCDEAEEIASTESRNSSD